jgi:hypothetical protein
MKAGKAEQMNPVYVVSATSRAMMLSPRMIPEKPKEKKQNQCKLLDPRIVKK